MHIPRNALTVITGVSGSGKSSLAFDTLYAEGQRRYLEHLSPDLRKLAGQLPKADVDGIFGLTPTVAISQHHQSHYHLATVASHVGIYEALTILYARIGQQYSPHAAEPLSRYSIPEMVELLMRRFEPGSRLQLLAPAPNASIEELLKRGFIRARMGGVPFDLDGEAPKKTGELEVVVDRIVMDEAIRDRLSSSIETCLELSNGILRVQEGKEGPIHQFSQMFLCPVTGERYLPLRPRDLNFQSPSGACSHCNGRGTVEGEPCPQCRGARVNEQARLCKINSNPIHELHQLPVKQLKEEVLSWRFEGGAQAIFQELLPALDSRLTFLIEAGLGYLPLNRAMSDLSTGEAQRVQLTALLGTGLSGITYVLDEPSLGLHPLDMQRLSDQLRALVNADNTVIVVEHARPLIEAADHVVEIGPGAGERGGHLLFTGSPEAILSHPETATGAWLSGELEPLEAKRRTRSKEWITLKAIKSRNVALDAIKLPLGRLVVLCGVSGSGKSALLNWLADALQEDLQAGGTAHLEGHVDIQRMVLSDQRTAGRSNRSMPATYVGIMTPLRKLFSQTRLAQARGYDMGRFSLNRKGGRCDGCDGIGQIQVALDLVPDIEMPCELCNGLRYNYETLQVHWAGYSIADILAMTPPEALRLFKDHPTIETPLSLMCELGLDYLALGQHASTLSGGELQRLKLVADLATRSTARTLYLLDEPASGLHAQDLLKLMRIFQKLVDAGHSVVISEHRPEVIQAADWIVELGPEAGPAGGNVIFQGTASQYFKR